MTEHPDEILLARINKLELTLAERDRQIDKLLTSPALLSKHIGAPIKKVWAWWFNNEARFGLTIVGCIVGAVALVVAWIAGGWPTNQFYIDYASRYDNPMGIYQKYTLGKDTNILVCENDKLADCVIRMKAHKVEWNKYQAGRKD